MKNISTTQEYKQTEIGVIPADWDVKRLGDIAHVATGNTPPTSDRSNYGEDYFFVSPADLGRGKYILHSEKKLSKKGFDISRKFPANSILFTCIGSTIGKSGIAPFELTSNQQINAIFPNENYSSDYLFYFLDLIAPKIQSLAGEQAVPLVNKTEFEATLVALPPNKAEQVFIGVALSDADILIKKLENLIEKKKNIKQGAMQELLTGKRRLAGFSDKWESKRLDDIFRVTRGQVLAMTKTTKYKIGDYRYPVYSSQTKENGLAGYYKDYLFENCITWTTDGANAGDVKYRPGKFYCTNVCGVLESNKGYANLCIASIFNSVSRNYVSYIGNPKLMNNVVADIIITIPSSVEEQAAISEVISDMDTEIEKLELQLTKYQDIKQGMMQTLLTGKIRLLTK